MLRNFYIRKKQLFILLNISKVSMQYKKRKKPSISDINHNTLGWLVFNDGTVIK